MTAPAAQVHSLVFALTALHHCYHAARMAGALDFANPIDGPPGVPGSRSLRVNLGGRYSADKKETSQNIALNLNVGGTPLTLPTCSNVRTVQKFNEFNGKARLEFDVTLI